VDDLRTLSWKRSILKSIVDGFPLKLSVRKTEGGTEIAASARLRSMASALFAVSGGLGILAGVKLSVLGLLLVGIGSISLPLGAVVVSVGGLAGLGGFWLLARLAFRALVKRSK
jgi:hypothetical protein